MKNTTEEPAAIDKIIKHLGKAEKQLGKAVEAINPLPEWEMREAHTEMIHLWARTIQVQLALKKLCKAKEDDHVAT